MKYAMIRILCSLFLLTAGLSGNALADTGQVPNMSRPHFQPSEEQKQEVDKTVRNYFAALDTADYAAAYGMMADIIHQMLSKENYTDQKAAMQNLLGGLQKREILETKWVAPSENAPFPGTYAAVRMTAIFANASRYCGYIVLYQQPEETEFRVMREEINFIEDRMAQEIAANKSTEELDRTWAEMSTRCTLETKAGQ